MTEKFQKYILKYSMPIISLLSNLNITPIFISMASFLFFILASIFLILSNFKFAAIFLIIGSYLDLLDKQYAKETDQNSKEYIFLDKIMDSVSEIFLSFALFLIIFNTNISHFFKGLVLFIAFWNLGIFILIPRIEYLAQKLNLEIKKSLFTKSERYLFFLIILVIALIFPDIKIPLIIIYIIISCVLACYTLINKIIEAIRIKNITNQ